MQALLLDLEKCYKCTDCTADCSYPMHPGNKGVFHLIEEATRVIPCRHCEDAPCVIACPTGALQKDGDNLHRSTFLCTSCRSCVISCPFGVNTLETIKFQNNICDLCNNGEREMVCIESCKENALTFAEVAEDIESDIYKISDGFYAKAVHWRKQLGLKI